MMDSVENASNAYNDMSFQLSQMDSFYERQEVPGATTSTTRSPVSTPNVNAINMMVDTPGTANADRTRSKYNPVNQETIGESVRFSSRASLDGDYRPYHDALLSLLQSRTSSTEYSIRTNSRHESAYFFVKSIFTSSYSRSTQIQKNTDKSNNAASLHAPRLELEGHIWSLVARFLLDPEMYELLFWRSTSSSVEKVESEIQQFINNVVPPNAKLDPAAMIQATNQYFGYNPDAIEKHDSKTRNLVKVPISVKRRQIILDWIEGCHNRSIAYLDVSKEKELSVMWVDSLHAIQKSKGKGRFFHPPNFEEKIDSCHPDAHLLQNAGSKNPFHGNDQDGETTLLSHCLLLMKAGRIDDALELCSRSGQPWRVAAWDGNGAHGYSMEAMEGGENDEMRSDLKSVGNAQVFLTGNPQRALWKRNMWQTSESLNTMLKQQQKQHTGKNTLVTGSVVYEAAITAILADNTKTASNNPLLQGWMDSLWIFYKGLQARFMELIYHSHNNLRRSMDRRQHCRYPLLASDYLLEGTEFKTEEEEQLRCTEELSRLDEKNIIRRTCEKAKNATGQVWVDCIGALLTGSESVNDYLQNTVDSLLNAMKGEQSMDMEEYEQVLRFILHFVLFLDSLHEANGNEHDLHSDSEFYESVMSTRRNDLVLAYLGQLMRQKPLWEFTCLYASLLPKDIVIDTCAEFWLVSVVQEEDRRMVLKQAQEYFEEGTDLTILRHVVRSSIAMNAKDADSLGITSLHGMPEFAELNRGRNRKLNPLLEERISHNDVRKMHSIRWLCLHDEHYADAIVCSNMLLRKLLLESPCQENSTFSYDNLDDWTQDAKVYTAKMFLSRFLPKDLIRIAMAHSNNRMSDESVRMLTNDAIAYFCAEYQALVQLLDAHTSYETWKELISHASPSSTMAVDSRFERGSTESEVAMKVEKMNYVKRKRQNVRKVVQIASAARDDLIRMLDGGWLLDVDGCEEAISGTEEWTDKEFSIRREEIGSLRQRCLPTFVFLAFRVLYDTALWMDEFTKDIGDIFEGDDANDILLGIYGAASGSNEGNEDEMNALLFSSTWYNDALHLANVVASTSNGIASDMTKDQVAEFNTKIADANIRLMLAVQEGMPKCNRNAMRC